ncbi:hypothetical protein P3X46_008486 [Hevea brasiliensis]|uniref:Dirigent protein n=1 Tax=Hevea brasiliensis TaxID=3981 RepID=A0ABQ9MJV5_HEVBR|nr:hypothetical protein P3X46_008486 [Hevea brasiliensis]
MTSAKSTVVLTGNAAIRRVGSIVGLMDTGESADAENKPDGTIKIMGVTTTGEKRMCKNSQIFMMQTQNLPPPGRFSITFSYLVQLFTDSSEVILGMMELECLREL